MYSKGYLNINKYFAFVFVVFAVMSGVSDDYKEANAISSLSNEFPYFSRISHLLTQDTSRIKSQILAKRYNVFGSYIQRIIAAKNISDCISISFALGTLILVLFYINNRITQNDIWRKTVF